MSVGCDWCILHPADLEFFEESIGISNELEFVGDCGKSGYGGLGQAFVGLRNFVESEVELD